MNSSIIPPKIYLPPLFSEKNIVPFFYQHFKEHFQSTRHLFMDERLGEYNYNVKIVKKIQDADIVVLPNSFKKIGDVERAYIHREEKIARDARKPFVICIFGDLAHYVAWPGAIVLRNSHYRFLIQPNEIMVPAFAKDLNPSGEIILRNKSKLPTVSFCGFAALDGFSKKIKYHIKNIYWNIYSYVTFNPKYRAFKQGIYYRRKSLRILQKSTLIRTHFIIRDFFSSHKDTVKLSPDILAKEFLNSIVNSDFVLTPKGDGNFSNRFFETLSLGRIPVLIDTECILPLENVIDYSKIIVRVPARDISKLPNIISDFYNKLNNDEFVETQKNARKVFETYLRYDSFFNRLFSDLRRLPYSQQHLAGEFLEKGRLV